jgi:undecaprenyl-diphosphatase
MDYFMFQKINGLAGSWPFLDALGIFFARYFEYILDVSVFLLFIKKWRIIAQAFLAAGIARLAIVNIIRWIVHRPRPFVDNPVNLLLPETLATSFPSGHAVFYFALSFIVYKYNQKAGIAFFAASFLISISRVFVGVHWPSDILAGALIGIFCAWLVVKFIPKRMIE